MPKPPLSRLSHHRSTVSKQAADKSSSMGKRFISVNVDVTKRWYDLQRMTAMVAVNHDRLIHLNLATKACKIEAPGFWY